MRLIETYASMTVSCFLCHANLVAPDKTRNLTCEIRNVMGQIRLSTPKLSLKQFQINILYSAVKLYDRPILKMLSSVGLV